MSGKYPRKKWLPAALVLLPLFLWIDAPMAVTANSSSPAEPSYAITAWASEDGKSPGDVFAIAQDAQGYLWLGTPTGIVRFDGDSFRDWPLEESDAPLPDGPVHALVGSPDGSLWAAFGRGGGVVQILDGHVTRHTSADGAPSGVSAMIQDRHGAIWVAARVGVVRFSEGRWKTFGVADRYSGAQAFSLFEDRQGAIWVGSETGVYRFSNDVFELVDGTARQVDGFAQDSSGTIWISDNDAFVRRLATRETPVPGPGVRGPAGAWRLLADSRGQIWVATWASLMRMQNPEAASPVIQKVEYEHRMAGSPRALYEDRDNNIWIGMRGGLLRLSSTSFRSLESLEGLTNEGVRTTAVGSDGSVWVATAYALNQFKGSSRTAYDIARIMALHADRHGSLWISLPESFGRFVDGRLALVSVPGPFHPRRVLAMTTDSNGVLWLCSSLDGAMAWDGARLERFEGHDEVFNRTCHSIYTDSQDRIWIGFLGGGAAVYDGKRFQTFGQSDGLTGGTVLAILEDRRGAMWLITPSGVNRYANGQFASITRDDAPLTGIVPVLLQDDDGYLWVGVNSGAGVIRFHPDRFADVSSGISRYLEYAYFDETDGMQQGSQAWQAGVGGVRGTDGRLWVATGLGMSIIDPRNLPSVRPPLPPRVESLIVDGRRGGSIAGTVLPFGTSTIQFEYASVHLSSASKLRYRYRLDGIDDDWVVAGSARSATYKGLPSGDYRFRVSATDQGRWTEESTLGFTIAPPFYRTPPFIAVTAVVVPFLVVAAWRLRLRAVQGRYSLVFAERARVSREIHDTLLQSLAAIGVELETIASQMVDPAQVATRGELRRLRRTVGHSLRDARDSILELRRSPIMRRQALADSLRAIVHDRSSRQQTQIELCVMGRPRVTPTDVDVQLIRIAQEGLNNALKHSGAARIDVTLGYEPDRVVLLVADDGRGFDARAAASAAETGDHLGLLTMQERAARVKGKLTIDSCPGKGTTLRLVMPLKAA